MNKIKNKWTIYYKFLRENGLSLEKINPGSNEIALKPKDAIDAINLLEKLEINLPILGMDRLSEKNGKLNYCIPGWYTNEKNIERNYDYAKRYILESQNFSDSKNIQSYYVIVI